MIMDTRGMHELGLHDLQCHYRNLDPNEVAGKLRDTAAYLVENGPVIKSGETVEGLSPDEKMALPVERIAAGTEARNPRPEPGITQRGRKSLDGQFACRNEPRLKTFTRRLS
jgi:hypothetical protein